MFLRFNSVGVRMAMRVRYGQKSPDCTIFRREKFVFVEIFFLTLRCNGSFWSSFSSIMKRGYGYYAAEPVVGFSHRRICRVPALTFSCVKETAENSPPPLAGLRDDDRLRNRGRHFDSLSFAISFISLISSSKSYSRTDALLFAVGHVSPLFVPVTSDSSFESGDRVRVSTELLTLIFSSSLLC